jgi:hypothetical protein
MAEGQTSRSPRRGLIPVGDALLAVGFNRRSNDLKNPPSSAKYKYQVYNDADIRLSNIIDNTIGGRPGFRHYGHKQ